MRLLGSLGAGFWLRHLLICLRSQSWGAGWGEQEKESRRQLSGLSCPGGSSASRASHVGLWLSDQPWAYISRSRKLECRFYSLRGTTDFLVHIFNFTTRERDISLGQGTSTVNPKIPGTTSSGNENNNNNNHHHHHL